MSQDLEAVLFKDLEIEGGILIKDAEVIWKDKFDNSRLYYSDKGEYCYSDEGELISFTAMYVSFVRCGDYTESIWDCPDLEVEVTFNADVRYDGIRHLYFNTESNDPKDHGYLYCPEVPDLIVALSKVQEICEKNNLVG